MLFFLKKKAMFKKKHHIPTMRYRKKSKQVFFKNKINQAKNNTYKSKNTKFLTTPTNRSTE